MSSLLITSLWWIAILGFHSPPPHLLLFAPLLLLLLCIFQRPLVFFYFLYLTIRVRVITKQGNNFMWFILPQFPSLVSLFCLTIAAYGNIQFFFLFPTPNCCLFKCNINTRKLLSVFISAVFLWGMKANKHGYTFGDNRSMMFLLIWLLNMAARTHCWGLWSLL